MTEIWKEIEGYPNYQVSNTGKVKSLNYHRTKKEKILNLCKDTRGYFIVCIFKEGKPKTMKVHRLVGQAFLPNPQNLPQINHKDECKTNNNVNNLEWCDNRYNSNYGTRNERAGIAISKAQINNPKLSKKVLCVESGIVYPSTKEVQRQLGFHHSHISRCCDKKYGFKTAGGLHFEWVD